jgi:hypothetical protein
MNMKKEAEVKVVTNNIISNHRVNSNIINQMKELKEVVVALLNKYHFKKKEVLIMNLVSHQEEVL